MSGAEHEKSTERVVRGLKASIHNPRVSPEAKAHAEERLHQMGYDVEHRETGKGTGAGRSGKRTARKGRKSDAASKETEREEPVPEQTLEAEEREAAGEPEGEQAQASEVGAAEAAPSQSKHEARVLGGYKATLSKKGVSEEAKRHARQVLEEHDAI